MEGRLESSFRFQIFRFRWE